MGLEKDQQRRDAKPLHGLEIEETRVGTGAIAHRGDRVTMWYSWFLNRDDAFQTDVTTTLTLGERHVIAGLERGLEGMRIGGIRKLRVSPHLAYRDTGVPGVVPPNAVLMFEIELLSIG
jgi:FKBP-type peptidyl-prolyl cis-trans isomerase